VENVNKLVKKILGTVLSERKTEGQNPNWTTVLGSVAAVINSQCGRGKNSVTAFEAVFGQKMDHPLSCSKAEARRCWTIKERMLVSNEPDFDAYCRENYIIDDDDVDNDNEVTDDDGGEDNDGYFSEDEIPLDKMEEVDDDYFYEHLMDNTATVTVTPSMSSRKKKEKKEKKEEVVEPPSSSVMDVKTNNSSGKNKGEKKSFKKVVAADEVMDVKKKALSPDSDVMNVKEEDIKKKAPRTPLSKKGKGNSKAKSPLSDSPEVTVDAWDYRERPSSPGSDGVPDVENGIVLAPSCSGACFTREDGEDCDHNKITLTLNGVGDYVVFPALWWHHGFYKSNSENIVSITAQLFGTPSTSIYSKRSSRRSQAAMADHQVGHMSPTSFPKLSDDLLSHWDDTYSAEKFPPASNFFGAIDKSKNRHILQDQFHEVPMIEHLVGLFEHLLDYEISVKSVWLLKKEMEDDGFQEWHQDMKTSITKTIVINLATGVILNPGGIPKVGHDGMTLWHNNKAKTYFYSVEDGWKHVSKLAGKGRSTGDVRNNNALICKLNCDTCSPNGKLQVHVGNEKFIERYKYSQLWYEQKLCSSFLVLAQHYVHTEQASNGGIAMILANLSRPKVHPWEVEQLDGVRKLITIAYAKQHFAVLLFDIPTRQVLVYDGLHMNLKRWEVHIVHTLKKYSLQNIHDEPEVTCHRGSQGKGDEVMEIDFMDTHEPWNVEHDPILKQADGFNCGPIACLKVLEIYGLIKENSIGDIAHQQFGYRGVVMTFYENFIARYKRDFQFHISHSAAKNRGVLQEQDEYQVPSTVHEMSSEKGGNRTSPLLLPVTQN